jgi:hypothetical protein
MNRQQVANAIREYLDDEGAELDIVQDPQVEDVWAVRATIPCPGVRAFGEAFAQRNPPKVCYYVVYGDTQSLSGFTMGRDIEEVQFKSWPPRSKGGFV